ncbi:hypothetical protein ABW19_dt0209416 [Dactylella cylindrospora]|nr:hypothetical protein ABW19_dt0209416 [Dactylella cylindrospora]
MLHGFCRRTYVFLPVDELSIVQVAANRENPLDKAATWFPDFGDEIYHVPSRRLTLIYTRTTTIPIPGQGKKTLLLKSSGISDYFKNAISPKSGRLSTFLETGQDG